MTHLAGEIWIELEEFADLAGGCIVLTQHRVKRGYICVIPEQTGQGAFFELDQCRLWDRRSQSSAAPLSIGTSLDGQDSRRSLGRRAAKPHPTHAKPA